MAEVLEVLEAVLAAESEVLEAAQQRLLSGQHTQRSPCARAEDSHLHLPCRQAQHKGWYLRHADRVHSFPLLKGSYIDYG